MPVSAVAGVLAAVMIKSVGLNVFSDMELPAVTNTASGGSARVVTEKITAHALGGSEVTIIQMNQLCIVDRFPIATALSDLLPPTSATTKIRLSHSQLVHLSSSKATSPVILSLTNLSGVNATNFTVVISNATGVVTSATAAILADSDGNCIPKWWELKYFVHLNKTVDGAYDVTVGSWVTGLGGGGRSLSTDGHPLRALWQLSAPA